MKHFLFFIWVLITFFTLSAQAQNSSALPTGEKLTYNLSFATFTDAGLIELSTTGGEKLLEREVVAVHAKIRTNGIVQSTLIDLSDDWTTVLDRGANLPIRTERFLYRGGKQTEVRRDFSENQSTLNNDVYDLLSAICQIRRLNFNNQAIQTIKVWENEKVYETKLQLVGHENVLTPTGAINASVIQISTDDKVFNRYKPKIYLSDDERRLPILISVKLPQGELRAELVSAEVLQPQPVAAVVVQPSPQPIPVIPPIVRSQPIPKPYLDNQPLDADLPFALGENLEFEVLRAGQKIGNLRFAIKERKQFNARDSVLLSVTSQSIGNKGVFAATDKIESYIDPNYLVPFRHEINLSGELAGFNQSLVFDQDRGFVNNGKGLRANVPVGTHDALSFVYALRAFRFSFAQRDPQSGTKAAVFLGGAPIVVTLKPVRETIEFGGKKVSAIALTVITDNPQIDSLGLKLWLTDDARRLPLKFICNTPLGITQANLVKF